MHRSLLLFPSFPPSITVLLESIKAGCSSWSGLSQTAQISLYEKPFILFTFIESPFLPSTSIITNLFESAISNPCFPAITHLEVISINSPYRNPLVWDIKGFGEWSMRKERIGSLRMFINGFIYKNQDNG